MANDHKGSSGNLGDPGSLGVKGASGSLGVGEPRGQTDLEFLVEKILNRSDPKDTLIIKIAHLKTR